MPIDLVPRLEYRVYLNKYMDYFDTIPSLEIRYKQRFELCNDTKGQYILCFAYEKLYNNEKWLELCKNKKVDLSDYKHLDYQYDVNNEWITMTENTTWYDIFSNNYNALHKNKKLQWDEISPILEGVDLPDLKSMGNGDVGWYYNLKVY